MGILKWPLKFNGDLNGDLTIHQTAEHGEGGGRGARGADGGLRGESGCHTHAKHLSAAQP